MSKQDVNVSDFVASDSPYLSKEQITPYGVVRGVIERVSRDEVPKPGTSTKEPRYVVWFAGWKKGLVVGARCNRKFLAALCGGTKCSSWRGQAVWLYVDPTATYAGQRVGGVRLAWGEKYSGSVPPPKPTPTDSAQAGPDPSDVEQDNREPGEEG